MQREVVLTKEEESLLLDILFQQNYASEILAVELTDIENGLKQTDVMQYKNHKVILQIKKRVLSATGMVVFLCGMLK